jgi:hypothetical protein
MKRNNRRKGKETLQMGLKSVVVEWSAKERRWAQREK